MSKLNSVNNFSIASSKQASFLKYLTEIQKFPLLTAEEEIKYANQFVNDPDSCEGKEAAKILIQSHLRLVVKIANKFKNYGIPISDLVSEGNIGLIQALKKFAPDKGFRFSTYAMWWIRAFMQEYILRSWSLVKIGTTLAQKKLFFNLHKIKKKLGYNNANSLSYSQISEISNNLGVSNKEVTEMDSRLSQSDSSLNSAINDSNAENSEIIELVVDNSPNQEQLFAENQHQQKQKSLFQQAFETLNTREQEILCKRQMLDNTYTLGQLSKHYNVSGERIRQIEEVAIKKIKNHIAKLLKNNNI
jgi:RNA polymerase sigma-32 factor